VLSFLLQHQLFSRTYKTNTVFKNVDVYRAVPEVTHLNTDSQMNTGKYNHDNLPMVSPIGKFLVSVILFTVENI
jgi:hypothetical protein